MSLFYSTIKHMFNRLIEVKMKKSYKIEDLDCANCAAKIEDAIRQISGVKDVSVSFISQKLTVETDSDLTEIMSEIKKVVNKIEPDCTIVM